MARCCRILSAACLVCGLATAGLRAQKALIQRKPTDDDIHAYRGAYIFLANDDGNTQKSDATKVAVITGIDSNGNPIFYAGNSPTASDNIFAGATIVSTDSGFQGVGGGAITLAQLGISAGATIHGYPNMAGDSNTSGSDLAEVNGPRLLDHPSYEAPEPSYYGAAMAAMGLGLFILRRRQWWLAVYRASGFSRMNLPLGAGAIDLRRKAVTRASPPSRPARAASISR